MERGPLNNSITQRSRPKSDSVMGLAGQPMQLQNRIYGIDFSGAQDGGKKIWIAEGVVKKDLLLIEECFRARDLLGSGNKLDKCLPALKDFIKENQDAAFGLDFPFGLPEFLVEQESWKEFIFAFPNLYDSPDHFRETCFSDAGNRELKRKTDKEAKTPFSPYNRRIYKQTYYGISEILNPLVRGNHVCVLPMEKPITGKAWIFEICPASTLKSLGLYIPYKGPGEEERAAREKILWKLSSLRSLQIKRQEISKRIIGDQGGDAMDSVIATISTFCALRSSISYRIEGYVYV